MEDLPMIILYVADQEQSTTFYKTILNKEPVLSVPGMTEFNLTGDLLLGLMPENSIAKILTDKTPHPNKGNGIPRCELYLFRDDVLEAFNLALKAGAKEISKSQDRDWGHIVAYVSDPDGHVIAFAKRKSDNS